MVGCGPPLLTAAVYRPDRDPYRRMSPFHITDIFEYLDDSRSTSRERPYFIAQVVDHAPLQDGHVLRGELEAIIGIATSYDMKRAFAQCDKYIVRKFSWCCMFDEC